MAGSDTKAGPPKVRVPLPGLEKGKQPRDEEMQTPPSVDSSEDEDENDNQKKEVEGLKALTSSQQVIIQEQVKRMSQQQLLLSEQEARLDEQSAKMARQELESANLQNQLAQLEERMITLMDNQGMGGLDPPPVATTAPRTKGPTVEKYGGEKGMARPFLTNMELYFRHHDIRAHMDKIMATSMHLKDEASRWMQPIMDDYLINPTRMRED